MTLSWFQIFRLGLVQMALGAIVVLMTATFNRLMVVELALPAVLSGSLIAWHYGVQLTRPKWGYASDAGGKRTPWIIGGMAMLALGGLGAAYAIALFEASYAAGLTLSILSYALIGLGVGASGTSLLALIASATAVRRRPAAAMIVWLMMIFGIALTAGLVGANLDPYSHARLIRIVAIVAVAATLLTTLAVWGIEARVVAERQPDPMPFRQGLAEVWSERRARHFTVFVFLSMTAFFLQDPILEPYAGHVFGMTAGESTSLSGQMHGGMFIGMLTVGICASWLRWGALRTWVMAGCLGSAATLCIVSLLGPSGWATGLVLATTVLGFFNGMFAIAAIGSMMTLASEGRERREGTRMGIWGAAQAIAAAIGTLGGAALVDALRLMLSTTQAYGAVFFLQAALFAASAFMAAKIMQGRAPSTSLVPGE